ncbi:MAG: extracellular solute-binding protein [Oscillospiraceae bacterium]|nr:extracellular solute-binding protein [Oscillospiraceae bacterium]
MPALKKTIACILSAAAVLSLTACEEEAPVVSGSSNSAVSNAAPAAQTTTTQASTTIDADAELALTDKENKVIDTSACPPTGHAGKLKYLGYFDITKDQKGTEQCLIFQSDLYGGEIEYMSTPFGQAFYDKLGSLIASDDSPDLVEKYAMMLPGNVSKNLFEPLDDKIDLTSPVWKDISGVVEQFAWKGQHFYYPHRTTTKYALNYSKKTIEENNLTDPYELYAKGEWTWEAWRKMMVEFCNKDDAHVGFYTTNNTITSFIATTGTTMIDVQPDGTITNNLLSAEVSRAMTFMEELCRDGLTYDKSYGDWVSPQVFSTACNNILFTCTEPEWTYIAATENLQNKEGVDNDIFGEVSEFSFVPFPRDTMADAYYTEFDTFGYLVPKGAKNIDGAVEFINLNRMYDIDPEVQAKVREDHVNPTKIYFEKGKYKGSEKWQITWGEHEYDLWREMCDPANFSFIMENAEGFSLDFTDQIGQLLMGVVERGESWAKTSAEFSPIVDATISEYQ